MSIGILSTPTQPNDDEQNLGEGYPSLSSPMTIPNPPTLNDFAYRGWTNTPRQLEPEIDYPLQSDGSLSSFRREMQK